VIGIGTSSAPAGGASVQPVVVRCSAPAKVMLFGEYAVLEGHPSLAMCLNRRIACEVRRGPADGSLLVEAPGVFPSAIEVSTRQLSAETSPSRELGLLWPVLRRHAPHEGGLQLRFSADFPPTWGLGSSSASTLAAVSALRHLSGQSQSPLDLFAEVRDAQRSLQGQASGYDVAAQLLGGYVRFQDGEPPQLTRVEPPAAGLDWIVGWSGNKASTGAMIEDVRNRFPEGHEIYADIGAVAREGIRSLEQGDPTELGRALNAGHALLEQLGAVPGEPGAVVRALQADPDVLGARLAGAGGGDCILILASDRGYAARCAQAHGLEVLELALEPEGLVQEQPS